MLKREVAKRVFAKEFEASRPLPENPAQASGPKDDARAKDFKSPNFLLSPLGLLINRVFVVGVVTEIDNVGGQNEMWKARIVDPTGAFTVYAGQFQPEASIFFSTVEVPAFVSLTGKARVFEPEPGAVFVSVRAEEVNVVDEEIRNRWVVDTAEQTVERLEAFYRALESGLREEGAELSEYLKEKGTLPELSDGISAAFEKGYISELFSKQLGETVKESLQALDFDAGGTDGAEADHKEFVLGLLREIGGGKKVEYTVLLETAVSRGLFEDAVKEAVLSLLAEGQCYEPRVGLIRPVS